MPFREFFRGLMGIPPRVPDENNNRDVWSNDPFYDLFRDFSAMIDAQRVLPPGQAEDDERAENRQHNGDQDDFSFQIFPEPQDMFRHFEEQFMRTFQGFGMMEFPSRFGHPPLEAPLGAPAAPPGGESASLRYRMLKPGASDPDDTSRADSDLDDRVQQSGLAALLDPPQAPSAAPPVPLPPSAADQPRLFSSSSFSVRRFVGPDGRVEETRTESGADGQTRQTVTRRLGDRQQTVVTRQLPDGSSEQEEQLTNMDEGGLPAFDRLWEEEPTPPAGSAPHDSSRLGETFWRNVFGW